MRRPFSERNPVPIGGAGLVVLAAILLLSFNAGSLLGGGRIYRADFSEAAGLQASDKVRISGITVGQVREVELEGAHVSVTFAVEEGVKFGEESRAAIKIGTVLGQKFLELIPKGQGTLAAGATIPLQRTRSPYDVTEAFSGLTKRVEKIDTAKLEKALDTVSATFKNSSKEVRSALRGLTRLSETIASRDAKLQELLKHAKEVSGVLAERNKEFTKLLKDGNKLLREVRQRRAVIHKLLINTVQLSDQLTALVKENQEQLRPALKHLGDVVSVLRSHQRDLARSIRLLEPFVNRFTDTLGTGRWFDVYLQNIAPLPATIQGPQK